MLSAAPPPEAETLDLRELVAPLRRQIWLVLGIALAVVSLVALHVFSSAPRYQSHALVRLKDARAAMTAGIGGEALTDMMLGRTTDPVLSEVQVLHSRKVLGIVVDEQGLRLRPQTRALSGLLADVAVDSIARPDTLHLRFSASAFEVVDAPSRASAAYGEPVVLDGVRFTVRERPDAEEGVLLLSARDRAINGLRQSLGTQIRPQTNVVEVNYTAYDPGHAQLTLDALIDAFQKVNMHNAQQQSRLRRIFIEEQLTSTDSMLARAQVALSDFRRRESALSAREKFAAEQATLMGLDVRREQLQADRRVFESLLRELSRSGGADREATLRTLVSSPQMAANPIVPPTYQQIARYQATRDSLTAGEFGNRDSHPDVLRLNSLIRSAEDRLVQAGVSQLEVLSAQVAALDDLKARSTSAMQDLPEAEAEEVRLGLQLQTIQRMADQLREEYQKSRIEEVVELGQVDLLDAATYPTEPLSDNKPVKLALGLILGLFLGGGSALLRDHMNRAIQRKEDAEALLRVPTLAVIPQIAARAAAQRRMRLPRQVFGNGKGRLAGGTSVALASGGSELVTTTDLRSSSSEAYRTLRTNLIFSQAIESLRTLVITSSTPTEGKTTTAANLAVTFAQQGVRVLLVDCDLRKGRLHHLFDVPQEPGLTQVVLGFDTADGVIRPSGVEGLDLLTTGTLPPNPSELLGGERMRKVLSALGEQYEVVILDTPPLLAAADAAMLGKFCDGVLLVLRAGYTDRGAAQQSMQQLRTVGARVLGTVLNDPDSKVASYGGYYYGSYAGYYGAESEIGAAKTPVG